MENFQEGNQEFWIHLTFINFERKFKCHGVEYGALRAVNF